MSEHEHCYAGEVLKLALSSPEPLTLSATELLGVLRKRASGNVLANPTFPQHPTDIACGIRHIKDELATYGILIKQRKAGAKQRRNRKRGSVIYIGPLPQE